MDVSQTVKRAISDIPGMEKYEDYYVDVLGNVWSYKRKNPIILKTGWMKAPDRYRYVSLTANDNTRRNFCVHRLVAMAFIPIEDLHNRKISHKNRIDYDNRLENLTWEKLPRIKANKPRKRKKTKKKKRKTIVKKIYIEKEPAIDIVEMGLKEDMVNKMQSVLMAANVKGLPVATSSQFFNKMINESLEDFIRQYGLRKVMDLK